jgi:hypothetical protein
LFLLPNGLKIIEPWLKRAINHNNKFINDKTIPSFRKIKIVTQGWPILNSFPHGDRISSGSLDGMHKECDNTLFTIRKQKVIPTSGSQFFLYY